MTNTDKTDQASTAAAVAVDRKMDVLRDQARRLRLSHMASKLPDLLHNAAIESPSYLDFAISLLDTECKGRAATDLNRRLTQARLPRTNNLDNFDFGHSAGISRSQLKQMRELVWVDQKYNLVLMGPSGTGKTYIAAGLVRDAVIQGMRAKIFTMEDLVGVLRRKDLSSIGMRSYESILRCDLLAIDDIMLMPMKKEEAVAFFNLINSLHEKTSIIIILVLFYFVRNNVNKS